LWGVDFVTHKAWNPSPEKIDSLNEQLGQYKELVNALNEVGVKVYLGHTGSMLGEFLPLYHLAKMSEIDGVGYSPRLML